jgi:hypothetical protein
LRWQGSWHQSQHTALNLYSIWQVRELHSLRISPAFVGVLLAVLMRRKDVLPQLRDASSPRCCPDNCRRCMLTLVVFHCERHGFVLGSQSLCGRSCEPSWPCCAGYYRPEHGRSLAERAYFIVETRCRNFDSRLSPGFRDADEPPASASGTVASCLGQRASHDCVCYKSRLGCVIVAERLCSCKVAFVTPPSALHSVLSQRQGPHASARARYGREVQSLAISACMSRPCRTMPCRGSLFNFHTKLIACVRGSV